MYNTRTKNFIQSFNSITDEQETILHVKNVCPKTTGKPTEDKFIQLFM